MSAITTESAALILVEVANAYNVGPVCTAVLDDEGNINDGAASEPADLSSSGAFRRQVALWYADQDYTPEALDRVVQAAAEADAESPEGGALLRDAFWHGELIGLTQAEVKDMIRRAYDAIPEREESPYLVVGGTYTLLSGACRDVDLTAADVLRLVDETCEPGEEVEVLDALDRPCQIVANPTENTLTLIDAQGGTLAVREVSTETASRFVGDDF